LRAISDFFSSGRKSQWFEEEEYPYAAIGRVVLEGALRDQRALTDEKCSLWGVPHRSIFLRSRVVFSQSFPITPIEDESGQKMVHFFNALISLDRRRPSLKARLQGQTWW
jgi:hypothetical protein